MLLLNSNSSFSEQKKLASLRSVQPNNLCESLLYLFFPILIFFHPPRGAMVQRCASHVSPAADGCTCPRVPGQLCRVPAPLPVGLGVQKPWWNTGEVIQAESVIQFGELGIYQQGMSSLRETQIELKSWWMIKTWHVLWITVVISQVLKHCWTLSRLL